MDRAVSLRKFDAELRLLSIGAAAYVTAKRWRIISTDYPTLAVALRHSRSSREIEFRFTCDNWDEAPPSLTLHALDDGHELPWDEWPKGGWHALNKHPTTAKPFLCVPGIREYHTHSSHLGDKWDGYRRRGTYGLCNMIDRVHQKFEQSNG